MTASDAPEVVIDDLVQWETVANPEPEPAAPSGTEITSDGFLTKDAFWSIFMGAFTISGSLTRLQSLKVEPDDDAARAASDAVYDCCYDTPSLQFIIRPDNVWMERAVVIGAFGFGKAAGVAVELRERKAAKVAASKPAEPAPPSGDAPEAANDASGIDWVAAG